MASWTASAAERSAAALVLATALLAGAALPADVAAGDAAGPDASAGSAPPAPGAGTDPAAAPAPAPAPAPALAGDLPALLAGMRSSSGVIAEFTETKELALLSMPLEATGTIYFVPPDRLVRVVTSPGRSRLVVDGDQVRFEDESGSKGLDLSSSPIARQLIDSFVVLFNGDEKKLKELYETVFSVEGPTWNLLLTPRSMPLNRMISSFELTGTGAHIDRMVAVEPDGDRAVTVFGKTDPHYRFSEAELSELFGEPPAS